MTNPTGPFIYYLQRMKALLQQNLPLDALLDKSLQTDMFALHQQLTTAISFSLRCCCVLAGREVVSFKGSEVSVKAVVEEINQTLAYLTSMTELDFMGYEQRVVQFEAGFSQRSLEGHEFVTLYALPNFLFHFSMAYAILRHHGVAISKGDFDGFHQYPAGFSFLDNTL